VLAAGYLLWMLQKVNFGEPKSEWDGKHFHDVDGWEMTAWVPLIVAIIAIGIYPKIIFGATNEAVIDLVAQAFGG
jgi:NADH-quinone oxidoreductase subunit M